MEAFADLYRNYARAWETGDAELWLSLWDEGGTQLPPGGPALTKGDLRRLMPPQFVKDLMADFAIELDESAVLGDFAFARGRYTCDYTQAQALPRDTGKFLSILKRQPDGGWKFYLDCYNATAGPVPPG